MELKGTERRPRPLQVNLTFVKTAVNCSSAVPVLSACQLMICTKYSLRLAYLAAYIIEPHSATYLVRNSIFETRTDVRSIFDLVIN